MSNVGKKGRSVEERRRRKGKKKRKRKKRLKERGVSILVWPDSAPLSPSHRPETRTVLYCPVVFCTVQQ